MDDVILNKCAIIERCLKRVEDEYLGYEDEFLENYTKQDSIILNIQRAIQASLDIGSHIIRIKKLGIPQTSGEVFGILSDNSFISEDLSHSLQKMIGFRNIAVHDYQKLDLDIVVSVVETKLKDIEKYKTIIIQM
jgi:uncharacterized protein YutE (UPF0331/DUF86 family)